MVLDYGKPIGIDQEHVRTSEQTRIGEQEQKTIQEWIQGGEHILSWPDNWESPKLNISFRT